MNDSANSITKSTDISLVEAKKRLRENFDAGIACPCCGQFVKRYKRPLNSSMGAVLVLISRMFEVGHYIHVEQMLKEIGKSHLRGDFHKLTLWGLLKAKEAERDDGSPRNGYYCLTHHGYTFAIGESTVPSHVLIYNSKVLGFSTEKVDIHAVLGKKFSYNELMKEIE